MSNLRHVIVEMRADNLSPDSSRSLTFIARDLSSRASLKPLRVDERFTATALRMPELHETGMQLVVDQQEPTFITRGLVDDDAAIADLMQSGDVAGVYSDPQVSAYAPAPGCSARPIGTDLDVRKLLGFEKLQQKGLDGSGVAVAVVDTGINLKYLQA